MPEGPEVTIMSQYLLSKLKNSYITKITVLNGKYLKKQINGIDYIKDNYKITNIESKGKLTWFTLENDKSTLYMLSHLGLSGEWNFEKNDNARIKVDILKNDKKQDLYFNDQRNFGSIEIIKDKKKLTKKLDELADDALKTNITIKYFIQIFDDFLNKSSARKNANIYKTLMNQKKINGIVSGLGNYLVAEILYNAKISPHRTIGSLTESEIKQLFKSIKYVIKLSYYDNITGYMENFKDFIDIHKKGISDGTYPDYHGDIDLKNKKFKFYVYRRKTDDKNNPVTAEKNLIKGRTVYWVPNVQK